MMINLTIDGKPIEVAEGTTILSAARDAGITIPTLCDHPELTPYGGCRLCLVEVDGYRTLQPSCTLPVTSGMVVKTDNPRIQSARKFILTLIFSERNHFCPYCQVTGGDCELQNAAYNEGMTHWPLQPDWKPFSMDASHPYIIVEHNRCILCRRCVRACSELVGNHTLGFEDRGTRSLLIADLGVPLGTSSCISCGACVQVCPTGSLIDRWSAYKGRETQVQKTKTICTGCSIGCGMEVLTRDNNLVRIEGDWDTRINGGVLCKVGRFYPMDEKRTRLTTPMIKKDGSLKPATWDEALELVADKFSPLVGKGEKGICAAASARLSLESLHLFQQTFAEGLKADCVTTLEEGAYTKPASLVSRELGKSFESGLDTLSKADCVVSFGVDLVNEHEVAGFIIKRKLPGGTKLIVIDPNKNGLDEWAHCVVKPAKPIDESFIKILQAAKDANEKSITIEIQHALEMISKAQRLVFVYGKTISVASLKQLIELAGICGAKLVNLKGEANSLGSSQYRLDNEFKFGGHQAVYLALGDEEPSQRILGVVEKAPFMVIQASFDSKLTAKADVVLPSTDKLEEDGHFISFEGKLQESKNSLVPSDGILTNQSILEKLSQKLGCKTSSDWKKSLSSQVAPVSLQI